MLGNHYGVGDVRKAELKASCAALGIWKDHCEVLDLPELQDDPKRWWSRESIQPIVERYVSKWKIDAVSPVMKAPQLLCSWKNGKLEQVLRGL